MITSDDVVELQRKTAVAEREAAHARNLVTVLRRELAAATPDRFETERGQWTDRALQAEARLRKSQTQNNQWQQLAQKALLERDWHRARRLEAVAELERLKATYDGADADTCLFCTPPTL